MAWWQESRCRSCQEVLCLLLIYSMLLTTLLARLASLMQETPE